MRNDRVMTDAHGDAVRSSFRRQVGLFTGEDSPFASRGNPQLAWLGPLDPGAIALEVACGGAHVAGDVAPHVRAVVGIDLTPELLVVGRDRLREAGIANVVLQQGDAESLPFVDDSFDLVYCRASLHHFAEPTRAVREMVRVCRPGGRVALSDLVTPEVDVRDAFDGLHRLIDPSHVRAFTSDELAAVFPPGVESSPLDTTSSRFPLAVAITEQSETARVDELLRAETEGGAPTGLAPVWEDDAWTVEFLSGSLRAVKQ